MKTRLLTAVLAVTLLVAPSCARSTTEGGSSANGSIALSKDDALLYAADADLDAVFVVDAKTQALVTKVSVGRQPEKVLVADDDTIYVANRMGRSVSVIRRGETTEAARLDVGIEPVGLAASSDGKMLYVVNATSRHSSEFGTVMAFERANHTLVWESPVGVEPRGIALLPNGRAAISLFKTGDLATIDLATGKVLSGGTDLFQRLNRTTISANATTARGTSRPRAMESILASPSGEQVYVTGRLSSDAVVVTPAPDAPLGAPINSGAAGYGNGACGASAVTAPSILTFASNGTPQVDDVSSCTTDVTDHPAMILSASVPGMPIQGPKALAIDPSGAFLFIANAESNNVAVLPAVTRAAASTFGSTPVDPRAMGTGGSVSQLIRVGASPTGIAVSHDGRHAYVFNAFDHSISRLEADATGQVVNAGTTQLADDVLDADVVAGRKLFFSATDVRMNALSTGIACASCHLEGREDGHVWNFVDGPRQTPSLAGRMLSKTAPFHWNGEFNDLMAFMSLTVQQRMGGSGVTPSMERQIAAFLDAQPAADNPHRGEGTPAEVVARGRLVFEKATCDSCHKGDTFTDNSFADVGTYVTEGEVVDDVSQLRQGGLNTPSLLGVARTGPYLHDGSALSLKARILLGKEGNKHGKTAELTDAEVDDLVAYLKTL